MKLFTNYLYTHKEIVGFLTKCPACHTIDSITLWSKMTDSNKATGKEGISCSHCNLDLSFLFKINQENSVVIDEYLFDYFKMGNLEFKKNDQNLSLYLNNTYVKNIDNNIIDINKYKTLLVLT